MIPVDLLNKLNLHTDDEFIFVENPKALARFECKYDRILYLPSEQDDEEDILSDLLKLCRKNSLILIADIPNVNKRLSNGVEKQNKDIYQKLFHKMKIEKFWFLKSHKENCFEVLVAL